MQIDWGHFTPVAALAGGALVGAAASWLILIEGKILGAAGIASGVVTRQSGLMWRLAALAGLVASGLIGRFVVAVEARPTFDAGLSTIVLGGLLVGFGARLGSGCTSGHVVCGLARLSARSLVATIVFMAAAIIVVFVARRFLG